MGTYSGFLLNKEDLKWFSIMVSSWRPSAIWGDKFTVIRFAFGELVTVLELFWFWEFYESEVTVILRQSSSNRTTLEICFNFGRLIWCSPSSLSAELWPLAAFKTVYCFVLSIRLILFLKYFRALFILFSFIFGLDCHKHDFISFLDAMKFVVVFP